MKAVKKSIAIDAHEYKNERELRMWVDKLNDRFLDHFFLSDLGINVKTLEGTSYVLEPNKHVIIRGVRGEYYPCDKEIFYETYNVISNK